LGLANALGTGRSDAFQVGAYGIDWFGAAYLAGALAFSNHWFTTDRAVQGDQLTAHFTSLSLPERRQQSLAPCAAGMARAGAARSRAFCISRDGRVFSPGRDLIQASTRRGC